ncbi:hypothetical protein HanIR_Chr16g0798051 [Helianthus annuus]|nr:hypothetical protein HanIR_Chr16g0798051 [Helianthus annuus]
MYLECTAWEKHRERLAAKAKLFEQGRIKLQENRDAFDKEKKSEEWGLQGLTKKLQASEDLLAEEHKNWHAACENDNKKMHVIRTKITNLVVQVDGLKKSEADFMAKYEEAKSHRERIEVDLSAQINSKDWDLASKDAEIAELKRRLREVHEGLEAEKQKTDSLEIDLTAERVKAETAEEARQVSLASLNLAQENYAEVQSTVEPLLSDRECMKNFDIAHIANSILNATELDKAVAALTMAARAAGHRA